MTEKVFAPNVERTEGLVDFPLDTKIRKMLWPAEYVDHPAKYSCHLALAISEYLTSPGQTILDPMSGTGTTAIAALYGRSIINIELVEKFYQIQEKMQDNMLEVKPDASIILLHGDCMKFLPLPADCIIFSPVYPVITMGKDYRKGAADYSSYGEDDWSAAGVGEFIYWQRMEKIYSKLCDSAPLMAYTIRDSIRQGEVYPVVQMSIDLCEKVGWKLRENILIATRFTNFGAVRKKRGLEIIEQESILIFERK